MMSTSNALPVRVDLSEDTKALGRRGETNRLSYAIELEGIACLVDIVPVPQSALCQSTRPMRRPVKCYGT
jgi:hypothetical protein